MDNNKNQQQELKIELSPEVANGCYSNLAVISHTANEFSSTSSPWLPTCPRPRCRAASS